MTNESASQQLGLKMTPDNSTDDHVMMSLHAHVNKIQESCDVICTNSLKKGKANGQKGHTPLY